MKKNYEVSLSSLNDYLAINNINKNEMTVSDLNNNVIDFILNRAYCLGALYDLNGKLLLKGVINEKELDLNIYGISEETLNIVKDNKAIIDIERRPNNIIGKVSYLIYGKNNQAIGVIMLTNSYEKEYIRNKNINELVNYIFTGLFLIILISIYFLSSKIVNPLILLKNKVSEVGKGSYPSKINITSNDEVGVLVDSFNLMSEKLKRKDEQEKNIFKNITHELKSPITSISGYAQILSEDNFQNEEFKAIAIKRIIFECKRMNELVGTLLDISKQISDLEDYSYENVNLRFILNDIVQAKLISIKEKSLEIINETNDISVKGNKQYLYILVNNLVENAVKYSDNNSKIVIKLKNINEHTIFSISSQGKAIPIEKKESIFEPFIKVDDTSKNKKNSHGLGLYICKSIVEAHNATIEVEVDGTKSKFIVKFTNVNTLETS
ncbi:HAMP domain-containing histidine kinase [Clostridium gasigenes]|uniref:histidine kinase n=1 Tax=Clostridium gasigenes TaxID=94869 RepID=A0A7X0V8E8_9CLOT|nr:HAMP domain-containing sensor histidine kinase [Clostridium gasigenes]MBB6624792.1 HAMP domain-containing histidine kinase [Clostridium gasigenes]MBB6714837.1 HAMP domain-containing histidine kinase [Clostridium gasigenes]